MVTSTQVTKCGLSVGSGMCQVWSDSLTNVKGLLAKPTSIVGTNFTPFVGPGGTNYSVPAATNLRIYGIEDIIAVTAASGTNTLQQLGYADDAAGTNFVILLDLVAYVAGAYPAVSTIKGFATGLLTVPTGKFLVFKWTNSTATYTLSFRIIGIETL